MPTPSFHFNALPKETRARFVSCLTGRDDPEPIISEPTRLGLTLAKYFGSAFGLGFLLVVGAFSGFGASVQAGWQVLLYGPGLAMVLVLTLLGVRAFLVQRALPYAPGSYMFPMGAVVATPDGLLKLYSVAELLHPRQPDLQQVRVRRDPGPVQGQDAHSGSQGSPRTRVRRRTP